MGLVCWPEPVTGVTGSLFCWGQPILTCGSRRPLLVTPISQTLSFRTVRILRYPAKEARKSCAQNGNTICTRNATSQPTMGRSFTGGVSLAVQDLSCASYPLLYLSPVCNSRNCMSPPVGKNLSLFPEYGNGKGGRRACCGTDDRFSGAQSTLAAPFSFPVTGKLRPVHRGIRRPAAGRARTNACPARGLARPNAMPARPAGREPRWPAACQ